jgi:recombination protein RecA
VTGAISPRRVVNWFDNGPTDHFLQFEVEGGPSGRRRFAATPGHMIFTPNGEVPAGELGVGDEVLVTVEDIVVTDDQRQVLLGGSLGDGSLRRTGTHTASFQVGHGDEQADYALWKHEMLRPFVRSMGKVGNGVGFDTIAAPFLADMRSRLYSEDGGRTVSGDALSKLDARGVAVWYGDDGSFMGSFDRWGHGKAVLYNKALEGICRESVCELFERLGVGRPRDDKRGFWFNAEQTDRLHALIAPYVHPALAYKLHPKYRGQFVWQPEAAGGVATALEECRELRAVPARILRRYRKPVTRSTHRFDIEVEGNHSYLVDGVVVHNSPETTAGGRALKFYASVRLDIRRIATLKEGEQAIGNRTRVKVVKNKVAAPFREAEFDILYNEGISREGELLDIAVDKNIVQKAGTWLSFGEERIGQGRENARLFLKEHGDVRGKIETKVMGALGLRMPAAPAAVDAGEKGVSAAKPAAPAPPRPGAPARPQPALSARDGRR